MCKVYDLLVFIRRREERRREAQLPEKLFACTFGSTYSCSHTTKHAEKKTRNTDYFNPQIHANIFQNVLKLCITAVKKKKKKPLFTGLVLCCNTCSLNHKLQARLVWDALLYATPFAFTQSNLNSESASQIKSPQWRLHMNIQWTVLESKRAEHLPAVARVLLVQSALGTISLPSSFHNPREGFPCKLICCEITYCHSEGSFHKYFADYAMLSSMVRQ